jgi:hypothetical protein
MSGGNVTDAREDDVALGLCDFRLIAAIGEAP